MKIITKTFNIYKYDELKKEIKEKVKEKEIENCIEFFCDFILYDLMKEKAEDLLKKYFKKATLNDVYYDLSCCQGSGAMIDFELNYKNCNIEIKHSNSNYYHEKSFFIKESNYNTKILNDKSYNDLYNKIVNINKELTHYGYNLLEYENFKEEAEENLKTLDFLEDGSIFIK